MVRKLAHAVPELFPAAERLSEDSAFLLDLLSSRAVPVRKGKVKIVVDGRPVEVEFDPGNEN